jgi:hypothetical protein
VPWWEMKEQSMLLESAERFSSGVEHLVGSVYWPHVWRRGDNVVSMLAAARSGHIRGPTRKRYPPV